MPENDTDLVKEIEEAENLLAMGSLTTKRGEVVVYMPSSSQRRARAALRRARDALQWYKPEEKQPEELILPDDRVGHGFSDIVLIWYEGTHARSIGYYCPKTGIWYDSIENRQCKPALWAYLLANPDPPKYEEDEDDEL